MLNGNYSNNKKLKYALIYFLVLACISTISLVHICSIKQQYGKRIIYDVNTTEINAVKNHFSISLPSSAKVSYMEWEYKHKLYVQIDGIKDIKQFLLDNKNINVPDEIINNTALINDSLDNLQFAYIDNVDSKIDGSMHEVVFYHVFLNEKVSTGGAGVQAGFFHSNDDSANEYTMILVQKVCYSQDLMDIMRKRPWVI